MKGKNFISIFKTKVETKQEAQSRRDVNCQGSVKTCEEAYNKSLLRITEREIVLSKKMKVIASEN